jgi:hypothetical protein
MISLTCWRCDGALLAIAIAFGKELLCIHSFNGCDDNKDYS